MTLPFFKGLRYVFTFLAAFQPARGLKRSQNVSFLWHFSAITIRSHFSVANQPARGSMRSQNVSFLSVFQGFTIRFHFCSGVSASAEPQAESERIVFARFSRVYDTFSLFQRRFSPCGAPSRVRTYRFCGIFPRLRYVLTFSAANQPVRGFKRSQNVSFLPLFYGFTIRFHYI